MAYGYYWRYYIINYPNEIWKLAPYPEYETLYVSDHGRVMRLNGKLSEGSLDDGYLYILVRDATEKSRKIFIHTLVLASFLERNDNLQVNHIDHNRSNNFSNNLEYTTAQQNMQHGANRRKVCSVQQLNLEGELIASFESISDASRHTGICARKICSTCKGRIINTGIYKWRYV